MYRGWRSCVLSYLVEPSVLLTFEPVFDESRTVFKVTGVSAILLEHARALATVNMLASLTTHHDSTAPPDAKPAPPPIDNSDPINSSNVPDRHINQHDHEDNHTAPPHVTFAQSERRRRMMSSLSPSSDELDVPTSASSNSSGHSTPTSSFPTSPVARALAARLSFWSRLPKPSLNSPISAPGSREPSSDTMESLEQHIEYGEAPSEVLESILASNAPPPATVEEKHSELDEKIVKETTKEFVKGGMFFSYSFGTNTLYLFTSSSLIDYFRHYYITPTQTPTDCKAKAANFTPF
jgi:phosphatidylinositol 4-phosphatase